MTTIMLNGNKINFYLVLLTLIASLRSCDMTAINNHLSTESRHVMKVEESSATEKLLQIRDLVKTLFFDWNFGGESEIEGRTFGRIRMMRQIMLPMAFLGGFLTAVIIGIKMVGIMNMLLISKVLMLNVAFALGKLMVGKALWLHKSQHGHHHHDPWASSYSSPPLLLDRNDDDDLTPYEKLKQNQPIHSTFNQQPSYFISPPQQYPMVLGAQPLTLQPQVAPTNFQPQMSFIQRSPYQMHPTVDNLSFSQDNLLSGHKTRLYYNQQQPQQVTKMTPVELDQFLTNTLSRLPNKNAKSDNSNNNLVRKKRKLSFDQQHRYVNLLRPFS